MAAATQRGRRQRLRARALREPPPPTTRRRRCRGIRVAATHESNRGAVRDDKSAPGTQVYGRATGAVWVVVVDLPVSPVRPRVQRSSSPPSV
ncbi:hypothetical protein MTO96_008747 [Rhipicephalus appendiculatus]